MARTYDVEGPGTVRRYAQVMGVVIIVVGVLGMVMGDTLLFGLLNIDIIEDLVHVATGALLAYAGFAGTSSTARSIVGVLGVVYLLVGLLGFVVPNLFGLLPHGYTIADNLLHLVIGGLNIAVAWFLAPR